MRCQALILAMLVVCSLGIAGYIHNKRKEELKLAKHASFQNVKSRVTRDVLKEYMAHVVESTSLLDKTTKQIEDLETDVAKAQEVADVKRTEVEACTGDLKHITDEGAAIDTEKANTKGEFEKKKASLQEQLANLKKQLEQRSKACEYIKKDSAEGKKLCNIEEEEVSVKEEDKKEEEKKEEDKKEEEKKEEDKKEEVKN